MNRKQLTTLLVLGIVVGGLGLYVFKNKSDSYKTSDPGLGQKLIPNFPLNDVAHVAIQQGTNQLNLVKEEETWRVRERSNYPANFSEVGDLLRKFWELKSVRTEQVGASQFGRLALQPPTDPGTNTGTLVEFKDKSAKPITSLLLGKKIVKESSGQFGGDYPSGRYVRTLDATPKVFLISDALANIEPKADAWLDKEFLKIEKIKSVSLVSTNATNSWKVTRETETGEFKLADAKEGEVLDAAKVSGVGHVLSSPSFSDVLPAEAPAEQTGLDKPTTAEIETFDGFAYTVLIGKATAEDNYHLKTSVKADIAKERTPGTDEKPEDKEKLDKEFKDKQKTLEDKLKKEQAFGKWIYLVGKWTIDPLLKERKDLFADKKDEKKEEAATPAAAVPPEIIPPNPLEPK